MCDIRVFATIMAALNTLAGWIIYFRPPALSFFYTALGLKASNLSLPILIGTTVLLSILVFSAWLPPKRD